MVKRRETTREVYARNFNRYLEREVKAGKDLQGLAKAMGISPAKLSQYRAGRDYPRAERQDRIARVLGVELYWMYR